MCKQQGEEMAKAIQQVKNTALSAKRMAKARELKRRAKAASPSAAKLASVLQRCTQSCSNSSSCNNPSPTIKAEPGRPAGQPQPEQPQPPQPPLQQQPQQQKQQQQQQQQLPFQKLQQPLKKLPLQQEPQKNMQQAKFNFATKCAELGSEVSKKFWPAKPELGTGSPVMADFSGIAVQVAIVPWGIVKQLDEPRAAPSTSRVFRLWGTKVCSEHV
jgi:hypothetical protein